MFTGIVKAKGRVASIEHSADAVVLTLESADVLTDAHHGDSIAVNGVCLTVTEFDTVRFTLDVMKETLDRTSLGALQPGSTVNLERAMRADARFGGHVVQGHVDGVGTVSGTREEGIARVVTVEADPALLRYVVEKGSVALDGVSLTVARVDEGSFDVWLIPETLERTNLSAAAPGRPVNLEVDIVAKYVEKLVGAPS